MKTKSEMRLARPHEAEMISALAIRSKAHWGYTPEQMQVFLGELTLSAEQLQSSRAHVLEIGGEVLGGVLRGPRSKAPAGDPVHHSRTQHPTVRI